MTTTVFHIDTQEETTYTLPPKQALVACYEQARKNWNTHFYGDPEGYPIEEGTFGFVLGGFWASKNPRK
jgi:hypothetical protein